MRHYGLTVKMRVEGKLYFALAIGAAEEMFSIRFAMVLLIAVSYRHSSANFC